MGLDKSGTGTGTRIFRIKELGYRARIFRANKGRDQDF